MELKRDTLLGLRWSCDDSSSTTYPFYADAAGFSPKKPSQALTRKTPQSAWIEEKNVEFCRAVQEVVQPFSGGLAKSAALQRQSFMAALFHLQESNCGLSAQVILPTVSPSHAFNL